MERSRALVPHLRVALARYRGRLVATALLIALVVLCFKGWRIFSLAQALRADARALEAVAAHLDACSLATLDPLLAQTRHDASALRAEAAPLFPLTRRLGWAPRYGPDLAAAEPLLAPPVGLASAADDSYQALVPLIRERDRATPLGFALATRLAQTRPQLESARRDLDGAIEARQRIPVERLSAPLRDPLQRIAPLLAPARNGIDLALAGPELLGANGRRVYLLIAQNPDELRATGGLITGAGTLTVEPGVR